MSTEVKEVTEFFPYSKQNIERDDIEAVIEVLQSDFLTTGPVVAQFEKALAEYVDAKQAIAVSNGTAALHLAMMALDLKPGDWVIVPSVTFLATANAARFCGADVIFADVDPETGLMTAEHLQQALAQHTDKNIKGVIPVHLAGQTECLSDIYALAKQHNLFVVQDACHALGADYHHASSHYRVGHCQHADMVLFSFHPVKALAMGEGGAIVTDDDALANRLRLLRTHGMQRDAQQFVYPDRAQDENGVRNNWYYEMQELGYNYRVTDIQCALGITQLKKLDQAIARRRELAAYYQENLAALSSVLKPMAVTAYSSSAWHLYPVLIDFDALSITKAQLFQHFRENRIGLQVHYIPVHTQPYYEDLYGKQLLPGAQEYYKKSVSIPLYPTLKESNADYVINLLRRYVTP